MDTIIILGIAPFWRSCIRHPGINDASESLTETSAPPDIAMTTLELPERPRILVITLRRLGDVLLTTPLIRTIRRGFPQATLDLLVFRDTAEILKGNPDVDNVVSMPARPSAWETLSLVRSLWRQYDLAVSTQAGGRPPLFSPGGGAGPNRGGGPSGATAAGGEG